MHDRVWLAAAVLSLSLAATTRRAAAEDRVSVEVVADAASATLQRRLGTSAVAVQTSSGGSATGIGEAWEDVCVAPCTATVPPQQTMRIAGDGVTPSDNFVVRGDARITASTGSIGVRRGGVVLTSLGLTAGLTGGVFLVLDATRAGDREPILGSALTWGLVLGGAAAFITGAIMVATSGTGISVVPKARTGLVAPDRYVF
jgi:hypothetical protein